MKRNDPEAQQQIALMQWAKYQSLHRINPDFPRVMLGEYLWHIPNEAKRSVAGYVKQKKMGVKSGAPDIQLLIAISPYSGMFIEMKAPGKKPTPKQKARLEFLADPFGNGYYKYYAIWEDNWEEAASKIVWYLCGEPKGLSHGNK